MDDKTKGAVKETAPQFKTTTPFIFAGKTYLPSDKKNVPQDAQEAFTAMLKRMENK